MSFNFFTFGGSQLWEDVFFYQKWRIQRHYHSKKYRLLDNWDIRRATGSFEDCRKAFVKFVEVYEIPRQQGELVILLHGLGETKNIFRPLWRELTQRGYNVAAINYPSTRKSIANIITQLEFFLNHCEDVSKVSFITKGAGCLVLRSLIANTYGWQNKFRLNKIINVNPINCGSDLFDLMSRFGLFNIIFGPMLKECTPQAVRSISKLPSDINTALIFCDTFKSRLLRPIAEKFKGSEIQSEEKETDFSKNIIEIQNKKLNIFNNNHIVESCIKFIANGKL
ncbi:MAG: hypothetical protein E7016_06655 [Alphaproteobacteria bacterium]|nr:hypothetical protein [Alphaproteobacteria bacterium]